MSGPQWVHKPLHDPIGVTREWLNEQAAIMHMEPAEMLERLNRDWPTVVVGVVYFKPESLDPKGVIRTDG